MSRQRIFTCICTLAIATFMSGTAKADAESAAARCVSGIQNTVQRSESLVAERTAETVVLIDRLLNAGRVEAAVAAARDCVQQTREDLRLAGNYIDDITNDCIRSLVRMQEYQLARRVDNARETAFGSLVNLLERQENALADALGN